MAHFKCLACTTRLYSAERDADPIGDLCPVCGSLLEPVGGAGEIVGYRVIATPGGVWHSGGSRAGELIAGRVAEIFARCEFKCARVRPESDSCDAASLSPQVQAGRAPDRATEP
jgi:hypothetical protein